MGIISPISCTETIRINRRLPIVPQVHFYLRQLIIHCMLHLDSLFVRKISLNSLRSPEHQFEKHCFNLRKRALSRSILNPAHVFLKLVWERCVRVISFVKPWKCYSPICRTAGGFRISQSTE